ncbi:MAG TPA: ATP-binding protein [Candidatus Thermoplasmatota archaeon]|nr:ATP-binding protein [Candidatus Thermoplasmatota archaeon]
MEETTNGSQRVPGANGGDRVTPEFLGRIVGDSVLSLRFRARYGVDLYVGDILVAEDEESGHQYLLRVLDVRFGCEATAEDWMERTAGTMLRLETGDGPAPLGDREWRLYKTGVCAILGYLRDGTFLKAKTIPGHFARVRRADARDYDFLREYAGDLEVGFLRSGEDVVPIPVGIDGQKSFPYHVGVFATTGMGKSNLMKVLAASALARGRYGLLILDPHGEYYDGASPRRKGLVHHPMAKRNLVVYSHRPLAGPHHFIRLAAQEIDAPDVMNIYEFSGPQRELLSAARHRYGRDWLLAIRDKSAEEMRADFGGQFHEGTVQVIKRRIERIFRNQLVHGDGTVTVTGAIVEQLRDGKTVLVDTGGLFETEELLVATVLARAVFERNKDAFGTPEFESFAPVLVTLEEAQRVLGKGATASANVFAQIAREGRKFKTGLCAITQQPKLLDTEVASQFNTLFILGLADARDREILRESAKQDVSRLENEIQTLMPGEALVTSPYAPFAVPLTVHLYEEHLARAARLAPAPVPAAAPAGKDFY